MGRRIPRKPESNADVDRLEASRSSENQLPMEQRLEESSKRATNHATRAAQECGTFRVRRRDRFAACGCCHMFHHPPPVA